MNHFPGEISHADIMMSSVPGLITQKVGFHGSKKFHHMSFFVNDKPDKTFVRHQTSTVEEETVKAKHAYELHLRKIGKYVRHYHTYNGTFDIAKYREGNYSSKLTLSFCGVESHHQNGRTEKRIKSICNPERSMLIYLMTDGKSSLTNPYGLMISLLQLKSESSTRSTNK